MYFKYFKRNDNLFIKRCNARYLVIKIIVIYDTLQNRKFTKIEFASTRIIMIFQLSVVSIPI